MIQLLGRLHIVFLHLPIGVLLLAALLEVSNVRKWILVPRKVLTFIYGVGSGTAIFTCISGYLLSIDGSYSTKLVNNHMWAGLVVAILSVVVFVQSSKNNKTIIYGSLVLVLSILTAGHLGGSLTHGEDFLWSSTEQKQKSGNPEFEIGDVQKALIYNEIVRPILLARCVACHGPNKQKGKLRMDTPAYLFSGGKSGLPLIGVSAEESVLYQRISLPLSDEEHMPPAKKPQLHSKEKKLLQWWLDNGSTFDQSLEEVAKEDTSIYKIVNDLSSIAYQSEDLSGALPTIFPARLPLAQLNKIPDAHLAKAKELDMVVLPVGKESPFLEVNLVNVSQLENQHWQLLDEISKHIIRLKISHLPIVDENLEHLETMENLMYLHLDHTEVTDLGMRSISRLPQLEYINLTRTAISNQGILHLLKAPKIKYIYAYQTSVKDSLIATDGVEIVTGEYSLPVLATDTIRVMK